MSESEDDNNESENNNEFISRSQNNLINIQYELARYFQSHLEECEDQIVPELNKNPNFMLEKDMKFNLYPLYINWKKIEENENSYFDMFVHFGYFGAAIYSSLREFYSNITNKNIIYLFSSFCYDFLVNENEEQDKKDKEKEMENMIFKLPEKNIIFKLIKNKVIMFKEIPLFIIILKMHEIYFLYKEEITKTIELLKYQYLLITYMTDDEYIEIFQNHFKGKVSSIFRELVSLIGNQMELPNTRKKYINHFKYIYQSLKKNNKEQLREDEKENEKEDEK